jgi:hypothetical protein
MHSYLSGRGSNIDNIDSEKAGDSFSSYLADPSKQHSSVPLPEETPSEADAQTDVIHTDETGIKIEVVSIDGTPSNLLVHIPDGRVIDIKCEY